MSGEKKGCQHKAEDITEQLAAGLEISVFLMFIMLSSLAAFLLLFWGFFNYKFIGEEITLSGHLLFTQYTSA